MQKLILCFLLILPFLGIGQTTSEASAAHQTAEQLLKQQYPTAQKLDLKKLQIEQKDLHKKNSCASCDKSKFTKATNTAKSSIPTLAELRAKEQDLQNRITQMQEAQDIDKLTLTKYAKAYQDVRKKIAYLEAQSK